MVEDHVVSDMRKVVEETPISETLWPDDTDCMKGRCQRESVVEQELEYTERGGERFYMTVCEEHSNHAGK